MIHNWWLAHEFDFVLAGAAVLLVALYGLGVLAYTYLKKGGPS